MHNAQISQSAGRKESSRSRQLLTLIILAGCLSTSAGQSIPTCISLVDHNQVAHLNPEIHQQKKPAVASGRSILHEKKPPFGAAASKFIYADLLSTTKSTRINSSVTLEKNGDNPKISPLANAIIGSSDSEKRGKSFRIGYGKMLADNSRTVGTRNGTLLEEPGCLYVKTTVRF